MGTTEEERPPFFMVSLSMTTLLCSTFSSGVKVSLSGGGAPRPPGSGGCTRLQAATSVTEQAGKHGETERGSARTQPLVGSNRWPGPDAAARGTRAPGLTGPPLTGSSSFRDRLTETSSVSSSPSSTSIGSASRASWSESESEPEAERSEPPFDFTATIKLRTAAMALARATQRLLRPHSAGTRSHYPHADEATVYSTLGNPFDRWINRHYEYWTLIRRLLTGCESSAETLKLQLLDVDLQM
ncbi:hypothetical protein EYF80_041595 [Liparis tanakae]|uniref:Uncharacterized protein n=1 Tax=Liparis tanakae TaxID=230148 RepID=A0A4Z2G576_9TELE|nr:hypothetical protein EYF80_041595 [Liparis tanakae]